MMAVPVLSIRNEARRSLVSRRWPNKTLEKLDAILPYWIRTKLCALEGVTPELTDIPRFPASETPPVTTRELFCGKPGAPAIKNARSDVESSTRLLWIVMTEGQNAPRLVTAPMMTPLPVNLE